MKNLKFINSFIAAVLFILVFGSFFSLALSVPPLITMGCLAAAALAAPYMPKISGAFAGVYREIWTGELLKYLTTADKVTFLEGIPDYSKHVATVGDEMQVIHLVDMDVLPEVLINNTTYPIALQAITQNDVPISLNRYTTKVTPITDDELYALSYAKIAAVKERHGMSINITKYKHAIHSIGPSGNTAKMPVLVTTGPDDGTGRRMCLWEDVLSLKREFDDLEIPEDGRIFVASSDHMNDLAAKDQVFKDQYYNRATGKPYNQLGFEFHDYVSNPYYNPTTKAKLSFGAVPTATDRRASVAFSKYRVAKAAGWVKMYYREAATDPENQRNTVNFRHDYIVLPMKEEARGAIVSANV